MKRISSLFCMLWLTMVFSGTAAAQDFLTLWNVPTGGSVLASGTGTLKMSLSPTIQFNYVDTASTLHYYRGAGSANLFNSAGIDVAGQSSYMVFRDPQSPRYSGWGGKVYSNSVGRSWYKNDRGTLTSGADVNFVPGSVTVRGEGGGSMKLVPGSQIAGTRPGEFRYQALDSEYANATFTNASGGSYVQEGRGSLTGSILWNPPLTQTGYKKHTADLIVSVRFGTDGIVTGGLNPIPSPGGSHPPAYTAARQLDLDVLVDPSVFDIDGRQSIKIRKAGQGPGTYLESGWTYTQLHQTSTVYLKDEAKGTSSTAAINWGNTVTIMQQTTGPYNTWPTGPAEFKLTGIELPAAQSTTVRISGFTSNSSTASRDRVVGKVKFPAIIEAPLNPGLGNGIDVSVRLANIQPVAP